MLLPTKRHDIARQKHTDNSLKAWLLASKKSEGSADNIRFDIVPAAVFTHSEDTSTDKTEDAGKAEKLNHMVRKRLLPHQWPRLVGGRA